MKIGISIPTYYRSDGSSKDFLIRALDSIKKQTHQDYIVFLIGDKYDNVHEFKELATIIPSGKIIYKNLDRAIEREKYLHKNMEALWCSGGVNARNHAINIARNYVEYCCALDDDDYFLENHLSSINEAIEAKDNPVFMHTLSSFKDIPVFPNIEQAEDIIEIQLEPCKFVHSSTCLNIRKIYLEYRDVFDETGKAVPADADMWERLGIYCKENNLKTYCIRKLTCVHSTEQLLLKKKKKIKDK